jgi:ribosomal protein S18 acetylase RimI-like enzyme
MPPRPSVGTLADRETILSLLRRDPLRHVVTLKTMATLGEAVESRFLRGDAGWALLSLLPAELSEFDRNTYPEARLVALVDGDSPEAVRALLARLPSECLVVKTHDPGVGGQLIRDMGARAGLSFVSFTTAPGESLGPTPAAVIDSGALTPEAERLFRGNGYGHEELERFFAHGARWFGLEREGAVVSACMVRPNYEVVWEVGALSTDPRWRRQGLARQVVTAAIGHLLRRALTPRYQVRSNNSASIGLATSLGLREFLRMEHFVLPERRA